jgi:CBS domain-containing protein
MRVQDIMTSPAVSIGPETSIFTAMDLMVKRNISGLPVTDGEETVVGVVSGYDLLALESTPGRIDDSDGWFPQVDRCKQMFGGNAGAMWNDFHEMRSYVRKAKGRTVGEVMHDATTVEQSILVTDAANIVVRKKLHRLMVVDDSSKLVGVLSRGDIMRATIENMRHAMNTNEELQQIAKS